tara:strand:+ start:231 stop:773 length:543 start_codon:yes stop_codon:yes gene_type:complete
MKSLPLSNRKKPLIGIIMGSKSDWPIMSEACETRKSFLIPHEVKIVSAHRTPDQMYEYAATAKGRGIRLIIAGAGGAAHLPGMVASKTIVPVLGVPIISRSLKGLDSLLSIAQMPKGVPVATFAIGESGAVNAALFAAQFLAQDYSDLSSRLQKFRKRESVKVRQMKLPYSIFPSRTVKK